MAAIKSLADELRGPLLRPDDIGYREEVAGFNTAVENRPDLVVGATGADDVSAALRYAADNDMAVAVQATGHGATAPIIGGLLITTRRMNAVTIDPDRHTATIAAGVKWRAVLDEAGPHGLAPVSGSSSDVGAIGYLLGGGLPVMCRTFGFGADRVRAVELVTADGSVHHVDAEHEPELLWGLCGGKGNLGIVTAMTVELVPVSTVYGGGIYYAAEHVADVLHAYPDWAATLPDETSTSVAILRVPPLPELPEQLRGQTVAHLGVCHVGPARDGERLVAPMRSVARAIVDEIEEMPYTAADRIYADPDQPVPFCQRGELLRGLTRETVDALLDVAGPLVQTPLIVCEIRQLGGALRQPPAAGNAINGRDAAYAVSAVALLTPDTADAGTAAVDDVITAVRPWSTGTTLVNFHGTLGDEADRARAWDPATYQRLLALSRRLDPSGLLRNGHAIGRTSLG